MGEPAVRVPSGEDQEAILSLLKVGLGEGGVPRDPAFWTWKHLASPFGPSYLLVAEEDGAIVGLRAFMRWSWWSGDREIAAARAVDTVTHPRWRGRGIFTRLTLEMIVRVRSEGVAFVFNTPNAKSRPGYLKMGWVPVGRLTPWARPRRAWRLLRTRRGGDRAAGAGPAGFASVGELLEAPGIEEILTTSTVADRRLRTRPDSTYLRWRYAEAPGLSYHAAWQLGDGGGAAIVFRVVVRDGRTELRLCEVLAAPTRESRRRARELISAAARRTDSHYVTAFAAPGTTEQRIVRRAGFLPLPRLGPVLTVRILNPGAAPVDPRNRSSWRPTIGALELF